MIGSIHCKACIVAVLACSVSVFGQTDQGILRLDLKSLPISSNKLPGTLSVYVEIATVQPNVAQGIVFTLNIENNGSGTVRIQDPIDTMLISLTGFTRPRSKNLRNTQPDFMLCRTRSLNAKERKARFDDKRAERPFQAFDVDEARRSRSLKTVSDIVAWEPPPHQSEKTQSQAKPLSERDRFDNKIGGKLTLEPGDIFQAILQITKVHTNYKAYEIAIKQWRNDYLSPGPGGIGTIAPNAPPRPEKEIIPIPNGRYSLSVSVLLFTDIAGTYGSSSDKRVNIQLGEPSSAEQKDTVMP